MSVTAKLEDWDELAGSSFTGIMMRASDAGKAAFYSLVISPRYGIYTKWRLPATMQVKSVGHRGIAYKPPLWFRLMRKGGLFSSYFSADGIQWGTAIAEISMSLDSSLMAGMAVASGSNSELMNAVFSHVQISDDVETSVDTIANWHLPESFRIYQNYPNPFNSETLISYDLPGTGPVRIVVFNLMGQKIRTLIDKVQPGGSYRIRWDGKNDQDASLTSGLYYCQAQFNRQKMIRKILFLQ